MTALPRDKNKTFLPEDYQVVEINTNCFINLYLDILKERKLKIK